LIRIGAADREKHHETNYRIAIPGSSYNKKQLQPEKPDRYAAIADIHTGKNPFGAGNF
jgi:hypothetical protein